MRLQLLAVWGVVALCGLCATARAEDVIVIAQIDLSKETVGQPPTTGPMQPNQVSRHFTAITVKGNNTLTVADKIGDLAGPLLKFDKQDDVNGAPAAVLALEPIRDGRVRLSWRAVIGQYQKGGRSQPFEPLLTLSLIGKDGLSIFALEFVQIENAGGGAFHIAGQNDNVSNWSFNQSSGFVLDVDLDQQTCSLKIDDKSAADKLKFQSDGPLRFVQFRDGTGLGAVDGKFTGAISDVKVIRNPADKK